MQVAELIATLSQLDPHAEVRVAYPSHDHWRNTLAGAVDVAEVRMLVWSDYHRAWKLPKEDVDLVDDEQKLQAVVLDGR